MGLIQHNQYDQLTIDVKHDLLRKYVNVSKHKRVLTSIINEFIYLYVNGCRLNEDADEVFVVAAFFDSLIHHGKVPMYTCSCGVFGCGGFYINVQYKKQDIEWMAEQSELRKYIFTRDNIQLVALELIHKLTELNHVRKNNGLRINHNIEDYQAKLDLFILQSNG